MHRRHFLTSSSAAMVAGIVQSPSRSHAQGPLDLRPEKPMGLAAAKKALPGTTRLMVKQPEAIRILQLTDIHFFCDRDELGTKADERTLDDFKLLVDLHEPHLLAVTGDLWHDNPDHRGAEFSAWATEKVAALGVPWLFTWGNHDELDDYAQAQVDLTEAKGSLYRGGHSSGNYEITLTDSDDRAVWQLVCLNTTTQGVQQAQEQWLEAQAKNEKRPDTGTFCFLHIPVLDYHDLWLKGACKGMHHEDVCTYGEDGSAFAHLKKLGNGSIKACFCGHDHVNDYSGTRDGIEMVYGRASGHAGYGSNKVRKGAKLISLNAIDGSYSWKSVFSDGSSWRPGEAR